MNTVMTPFIRIYVVFFWIVLGHGIVSAQAQSNPCSGVPFNKKQENYEKTIDSIFSVCYNDDYFVRFFAMPSFDPEYGFQIKTLPLGLYEITSLFFDENLWYSKNMKEIGIFVGNDTIETVIVDKMVSLLENHINNDDDDTYTCIEVDGTLFRVEIVLNGELYCCQFWESDDDKPIGSIVSSCMEIMHYLQRKRCEQLMIEN